MSLQQTLAQLSELDHALKQTATGDFDALAGRLERRAGLVRAAAAEITRLRDAAQPPPSGAREALEKSSQAGMHAMRQIILAKHMLSTELGRLKQEQRLLEALSSAEPATGGRLEIRA